LIDRGNCSFVTKVRNVQQAGGHIALIINNNPYEDVNDVIMVDDGRGRDLVIPGVLITQQQGEKIKQFYNENKLFPKILDDIRVEVDFEMENRTNIVKLDFFVTSFNENFYNLINEISSHFKEIKELIDLNIFYISHSSYNFAEGYYRDIPNCYGSGLHCHHPGKFNVNDGRIFLKEDINQKCILNYSKEIKNIGLYLDYLNNFYIDCANKTNFNPECSAIVAEKIGLPLDKINKCFHDSFDINSLEKYDKNLMKFFNIYSKNLLLTNDDRKKSQNFISFIPSLMINNRNFWGSWTLENIFEAICSVFQKKPQICYDEGYFKSKFSISKFSIFLLIILVIAINIFIFILCKNFIKKRIVERIESTDINHKINTVVTSYLALRESK
jgi:hypothetical protein